MNVNLTVSCNTCRQETNCRVGVSSQPEVSLHFTCSSCEAPISICLAGPSRGVEGAKQIEGKEPFDDSLPFVDLHLDFPVYSGPYVMGVTPFMRAMKMVGNDKAGLIGVRLNALVENQKHCTLFSTLIKMYEQSKTIPFRTNLKRAFGIELRSEKPQDMNLALFELIAKMMYPFELPGMGGDATDLHHDTVMAACRSNRGAVDAFVTELIETNFLWNLHRDCLDIYPRMFAQEAPLRAALFLDLVPEDGHAQTSLRVSVSHFEKSKDLFKDISETIARLFVLVAGINNLIKRQDHNVFQPGIGKTASGRDFTPKRLNDYADVDFGKKQDFLDDPWYRILDGSVSNRLRNAIAHNKAEYDQASQLITYFPSKEGMAQEKSYTITFLGFLRALLLTYREMRRMHHLVKVLFFYRHLTQRAA